MACLRVVSALALALGCVVGCAHHDGDDDDDGNGATLTITAASAMVALAPSGGGYVATQTFTVMARSSSGQVTDVTAITCSPARSARS